MADGRQTVAENLGALIELIQSRQHTGLLSVKRMGKGHLEEGEIYFHQGRPTYARANHRVGQDAFNWLLKWEHITFSFLVAAPRPGVNLLPTTSVADTPTLPLTSSFAPPSPAEGGVSPFYASRREGMTFTPPPLPALPFSDSTAFVQEKQSSAQNLPAHGIDIPGIEWLVPHKVPSDKNVLSLPLTRPQRSLYFLVDGQRTVTDLSRCIRKSIPEVVRLLSELQAQDLISL
jgi:hypothetical protein